MFITKKKLEKLLNAERRKAYDDEMTDRREYGMSKDIRYLMKQNAVLTDIIIELCKRHNSEDIYAGRLLKSNKKDHCCNRPVDL